MDLAWVVIGLAMVATVVLVVPAPAGAPRGSAPAGESHARLPYGWEAGPAGASGDAHFGEVSRGVKR